MQLVQWTRKVRTMTVTETTKTPAKARLDLYTPWPEGYRAMRTFDRAVAECSLEGSLLTLIKQRASQINGCAYCLDMHAKEARAAGEDQQRLDVLGAWREVDLFSERERAALALTEAITLVADGHVPDDVVDAARPHFSERELAELVFMVVVINAWNRIAITARMPLPPA
jgi:AhpD family alkylhydroperoxidase